MSKVKQYLLLMLMNFRVVRRGKLSAFMGLEGVRGSVFWV